MANYFSKITMPDGSIADIRDRSSMHWLGKTETALTDQSTTSSIVVGSITYSTATTTETSTVMKLRANDYVSYGNDNQGFIFDGTKWNLLSSTGQAGSVSDVRIDSISVISSGVAEINTTGSYDGDSTSQNYNPLATKGYVDNIINNLPEPMRFKGSLGKAGSNPTISSLPAPTSTGLNKNTGFTYKVIDNDTYTINTSPTTTIAAEEGDTVISDGTSWILIPSGDEPSGTVTNVAAGVGLTTTNLSPTAADGSPITGIGTVKVKLASETAITSTDGNVHNVGVNSSGQLAVLLASAGNDAYDATTNPYATKATVDDAIEALDISSTTSTASSVSASSASSTAATNEISYYTYNSSTETLTLNKIISTPVQNLLTKTTS